MIEEFELVVWSKIFSFSNLATRLSYISSGEKPAFFGIYHF